VIGHSVTKLKRIRIGHLTERGLSPGRFRDLTKGEVTRFRMAKGGRSARHGR
jgi:23S rRNA pseudouridine2605 synthase/16S rRNA pseudouridine516 synthase